jgi:hypothetical protein
MFARESRPRIDVAPVLSLPRPGRWASALTLGIAVFAGVEFLTGFAGATGVLAFALGLALVARTDLPRLLSRALYEVTFPAPFPHTRNQAALHAAMDRRNLVALLTEYWYGESRVARVTGVARSGERFVLVGERLGGHPPTSRYVARAFLAGLAARFEEAGLPTWQIDPRQSRAIDNLRETGEGVYTVVNLESGFVSPMASLKTWGRALRRGKAPFFDEVFFDITRAYIAREEARMRARLGDVWVANLHAAVDTTESATIAARRGELRTLTTVTQSPAAPTPLRRPTPLDPSYSPLPQAA